METVDTSGRLSVLRSLMKARKIDVYGTYVQGVDEDVLHSPNHVSLTVVPSEDSHASEYIAACDARRQFISGFSGSAGTAVITLDKAALATDGRYFNQAARQLDQNWLLLKTGVQDVPTWQEWTADESASGKTVGVDPSLISSSTADKLDKKIKQAGGVGLEAVTENLIDIVWDKNRPARPSEPVVLLSEEYAGKDTKSKLEELRKELEKKKSTGFVISMLDEIAWLFNLRGNDIPYNPVFFSYAVVTPENATLYVDSTKLNDESRSYLAKNSVMVRPYEAFFEDIKSLVASMQPFGEAAAPAIKFLISTKASWALKLALGEKIAEEIRSPVGDAKAVKNDTELEGMRQCHIRDGAALTEYFAWLEDQLVTKGATLDEVQAADKLEELRKKHKHYVGLSFDTISSTGAK
jgi:Xaa-Pro aminopeptidase